MKENKNDTTNVTEKIEMLKKVNNVLRIMNTVAKEMEPIRTTIFEFTDKVVSENEEYEILPLLSLNSIKIEGGYVSIQMKLNRLSSGSTRITKTDYTCVPEYLLEADDGVIQEYFVKEQLNGMKNIISNQIRKDTRKVYQMQKASMEINNMIQNYGKEDHNSESSSEA